MTCLIVVELCHDQTRFFLGVEAGELVANLRGKPYRTRFQWTPKIMPYLAKLLVKLFTDNTRWVATTL